MSADDGRLVSNFVVAALKGEPLQVYGDGEATRSLMVRLSYLSVLQGSGLTLLLYAVRPRPDLRLDRLDGIRLLRRTRQHWFS